MVAQLGSNIKPKKIKKDKVRLNLLNAMRAEGRIIQREFEKTTTTWKGAKPTFKTLISLKGGEAVVLVSAAGNSEGAQKWQWLNDGTPPHIIKAKNVPNLIFRDGRGFKAKTKVKTFSSSSGSNTGMWVRKKEVSHPGIKARDWTGEISKLRRKRFSKIMQKAAKI